ncbi:YadA-like family protein, partial [uncultured Megasphaera sp.]|uniref:YadA-like family protein n=1 Tax=uncultured Megasphaera sp. TaxID=165188 RepID=UPI002600A9CA
TVCPKITPSVSNFSLPLHYNAETTHLEGKDDHDDNTAVGYRSQAGYRSTALGYNSKATGLYDVALGTDALADNENSTAVGMNAQAEGKQATALGSLAKASGESATAVGEGANALAQYSSAVGQGASVDASASTGTALGYQAKVLVGAENSMTLGASSQVSGANSIAIGTGATVTSGQSIAIGKGATVSLSRSVALGDGSIASTAPTDVSSITIPNLNRTYTVSGNWPVGIVSVGSPTAQRTITNVAAGRVTSDSTDAVNGSELYAVATEAAKHATVKAAANSRIIVDNKSVNKGLGIEYTIDLNTAGLAKSTDGLTFAGDDGQLDNSKVISRELNKQLNIIGGAIDTVDANNIGVVKKDDNTLNIRLAKNITGLTSLQATTVISGTVTVDGQKNVITGLSNTTWDKTKNYSTSTKAATEAQIQKAMEQAAADANDTHIKAGDYAVGTITDKDGKSVQGVSMDVVDKTGTVSTVRITDVAKASDVGDVTSLNADIKNATGKTTVVDAVNHVDNKVGNLDYSSTKYVTKGESVTTSIGKLDEAIKNASEAADKHTIVSTKGPNLSVENVAPKGEAANYQISMSKDLKVDSVTAANKITTKDLEVTGSATIGKVTINKDNKGTIGGLTNKTWDAKNITSGQAATEDQLQAATKNAVNYDGDESKTVTLREDTTIKNVANTTIEQASTNAVNAGTVYNETRVEKDGIFIRKDNTAGQNITALDHQLAANTESIYNINNRVSNLDNRINKVGAGAAALAALHPLDFNPDDKWDFAVGYGNYRNANSVAFGAFYRPNEDTMFSLGTNFGNGENMFNAGISFKIGKGNSYAGISKAQLVAENQQLKANDVRQDREIQELKKALEELKSRIK